jgi:hypothetical protein
VPVAVITDRQGRRWHATPDGTWRPEQGAEIAAGETGAGQAFAAQGARVSANLFDLMSAGNPFAYQGTSGLDEIKAIAAGPLNRLGNREALFEPLDQAQGGASAAGQLLMDPLNVAAGLGKPLAGAVRSRMAERVAQALRERAARSGEAATEDGARSVGAAEARPGSASVWRGFHDEYTRIANEFTQPMDLNDLQRAAVPQAQRIGFQLLPGQTSGSKLMLEGIKSDPLLRQAVEPELRANRAGVEAAIKDGLGVPQGTPFTDDVLNVAEEIQGAEFDAVREAITAPVQLSEAAREIADPMLSAFQRRAIDTEGALSGSELMEVRSRVAAKSRELFKDGQYNAGMDAVDVVNEIDGQITQQLTGTDLLERWRTAQSHWRFKVFLEAGQTIGQTGELNLRSAATSAKKIFGKDWRGFSDPTTGRRGNLSAETSRALDWVKVSQAFADNVGNSGTATRSRAIELLTSPKEYAKSAMIGRIIRRQADLGAPE